MLSFLFSFVSCRTRTYYSYPPISISEPVVTASGVTERVFSSPSDPQLKNFLIQYLPAASADVLINKIRFANTVGTDRITINAGLGTTICRAFGNNYAIINLIKKDGTVKVKICTISANCNVTSEIIILKKKKRFLRRSKKTTLFQWRPLKTNELDQIYSRIQSKASAKVQEVIRMVKQ